MAHPPPRMVIRGRAERKRDDELEDAMILRTPYGRTEGVFHSAALKRDDHHQGHSPDIKYNYPL